jgi:hypothetical protein
MATVFDYLQWRGDLTFRQDPPGPVDALIFSALSYICYGGQVETEPGKPILLRDAAEQFFAREEPENFVRVEYDMDLLHHLDDHNGENRIILKELVKMARKLHIHTLVEGVETEEHVAFTKEIGCELAQGFYYHRPESLEEILYRVRGGEAVKPCESPEERESFRQRCWEEDSQ